MTDYFIKEDVFMALTGDITDCTIEEFIARLRDRLVKLPVKELPKAEVSLVNYSQDLVKDILSKAELVIDEDGKMIECVRVKHIIDALGYAPDKNVATNDLISRQAVVDYICHYDCGCAFDECKGEERCDFVDAIMTLPSAEVRQA